MRVAYPSTVQIACKWARTVLVAASLFMYGCRQEPSEPEPPAPDPAPAEHRAVGPEAPVAEVPRTPVETAVPADPVESALPIEPIEPMETPEPLEPAEPVEPSVPDWGAEAHPPTRLPPGQPPFQAWGGSPSCFECHEEDYHDWKHSHHALAQRPVDPDLDRPAFHPPHTIQHGTQTSSAQMQDGRFTLTTMGPDGEPTTYEPLGVIGVDPLWQYLIDWGDGRWQVTELAYDPETSEWFNVYGQEDRQYWEWGHWVGRGMNWNSMCATCHLTGYRKNYVADQDGYGSIYLELGVGCEQCHGPMQDHVHWQEENPDQEGDPTLVEFTRETYDSICGSCHARRADLTGRFMPGELFTDHYELILPDMTDTYYPDGQVLDENFEYAAFRLSAMHHWGVRCTDCHDWHTGKVTRADNRLCQRCHSRPIAGRIAIDPDLHGHHPPGSLEFDCADCHMPQTVYMARHWRRDHGMTIPDPLLTKEFGIPNACTRCHEEEGVDWAIDYVHQWYGERMNRPMRTRTRLLARIKEGDWTAAPDLIDWLAQEEHPLWRAVCAKFLAPVLMGTDDEALHSRIVETMVGLLDDPGVEVQAAAIEALEPLMPRAASVIAPKLDHPSRLVRIKAAWAMRRQLQPGHEAWDDLITYLQYNWDQPLGAFQWAVFLVDRGQAEEALTWFERAIAWDPGAPGLRHSYAVTLHELGQSAEAIRQLRTAAAVAPEEGAFPYALGLLYAEQGRIREARDALRDAVAKDPGHARFWYNLALAEAQLDDADASVRAIARAEALAPRVAQYPYVRATIHMQFNQRDEARQAAESALEIDPEFRPAMALLQQLRR